MNVTKFKKKYRTFQGIPVIVLRHFPFVMSAFWIVKGIGVIFARGDFIKNFSEKSLRFSLWHEVYHITEASPDELKVQLLAMKQSLKEGYSLDELNKFENEIRLYIKFGIKNFNKFFKNKGKN